MVPVRVLKDIGIGGREYKQGDLIEVEKNFAKILMLHKIVEEVK